MQGMFYISLIVLVFVVVVLLGVGGRRTIPGTPEATGVLGALWILYVIPFAVQIYTCHLVWLLSTKQGFTFAHGIALLSMILPFCFLILPRNVNISSFIRIRYIFKLPLGRIAFAPQCTS